MIQESKSPLTPFFQRGELIEIPLKVPLCQRGIQGDLKTASQKEFLANAISPPLGKGGNTSGFPLSPYLRNKANRLGVTGW